MSETLTLQAFFGISSPWAYFGALKAQAIAARHGVPFILRPIRVIEANGGIPLRSRAQQRQDYHELELDRWRKFLDMPLNLKPRFYPCRTIELAALVVIAVHRAGLDAPAFCFAVQRALWAEDRDIADISVLREIAQDTLGAESLPLVCDPKTDENIAEWHANLAEAEARAIFGTPTYLVRDELFWGQDRLDFVDRALAAAKA